MHTNRIPLEFLKDTSRFWSKVKKSDGCWEWQAGFFTNNDYGIFSIGHHPYKAHRVAYTLIFGEIPQGLVVMHRCDNPKCINPSHLHAGTQKENMQGVHARTNIGQKVAEQICGENSPKAKLTNSEVVEIRRLYQQGQESQRNLAKRFGVRRRTIRHILHRRTWKHI